MPEIFVGSVSIQLVPDARGWDSKVRDQTLEPSKRVGNEIGREMTKAIAQSLDIGKALSDAVLAGSAEIARAGERAGKDFADAAKLKIKEEFAGLEVTADLKLNTDKAKADWEKFKQDAEKGKGIVAKLAIDTKTVSKDITSAVTKGVAASSGGIGGIIRRIFGGGGGGGGGIASGVAAAAGGAANAAGTTGQAASSGAMSIMPAFTNPWVIGGLAAGGAAALPFAGQVAAGTGVGALGGGLAFMGIIGAIMSGKLSKQWTAFTGQASKDMKAIGAPMIPVLSSILGTASKLMTVMTPVFKLAESIIAGPLQVFTGTLIKAFGQPAVKKSITDIAKAFGDILTAMTPNITAGISSLAGAISQMANAVASNPKAFADFIRFLLDIPVAIVKVITWLTLAADWIESHWSKIWKDAGWWFNSFATLIKIGITVVTTIVKVAVDLIQGHWSKAWHDILRGGKELWAIIKKEALMFVTAMIDIWQMFWAHTNKWFKTLGHDIAAHFDEIRHNFAQWGDDVISFFIRLWDTVYNNTIGAVIRLSKDFIKNLNNWKNDVVNFFKDAPTWLLKHGEDIIQGLFNGMESMVTNAGSWLYSHIVKPILQHLAGPFGFLFSSPSKKTIPVGKAIMQGILHGMVMENRHAGTFIEKIFKGWPKAIMTSITKGLDPAKFPKAVKSFISNAIATANPTSPTPTSTAKRPTGTLPKGGTTGSVSSNGEQLYNYLLDNVFGGNKIAAAGATASIWGESGWNPYAIGPGGSRGLIQWTPGNKISNAVFQGGMRTQLPAIIDFISSSGDWGVINQMKRAASVSDAAYLWGKGVERYGVSDVHSEGIRLATSFMDQGGWLPPGVTMVLNNTGRHELVLSPAQQAELIGSGRVDSLGSNGNTYVANFDSLTGQAIEGYVRTAFHMMNLTAGQLGRPGRRS